MEGRQCMTNTASLLKINQELESEYKRAIEGDQPTILSGIYSNETNMAVWQRHFTKELNQAISSIVNTLPRLQASCTVTPQSSYDAINTVLGTTEESKILSKDITLLVDMFCCLFDLNRVGLRLTVLNQAMCPNFHVDKVPCRLVTTYQGKGTEWIPYHLVNRSQLSAINQSGLFKSANDIQQLNKGDVALLKGELWDGNENAGLVHRSPQCKNDSSRLLLTLDFINE